MTDAGLGAGQGAGQGAGSGAGHGAGSFGTGFGDGFGRGFGEGFGLRFRSWWERVTGATETHTLPSSPEPSMALIPGTPVIFQWRKWDGSPHWRHECLYLGQDQWGWWVGQDAGWLSERPGRAMPTETRVVCLIPATGTESITFNTQPHDTAIYIDLAWDVSWESPQLLTGIDMDLDVVECRDERGIWIDDEDEWQEHSAQFGYPPDVMTVLPARAAHLEQMVRAHVAPFDEATSARWFAALDALLAHRGSTSPSA